MKLLDFDTLTDTDLNEMIDREIPCELRQLVVDKSGSPPSWCTEVATHWVRLSCRWCGKSVRILACLPCAAFLRRGLRIVGLIIIPWVRHVGCRRLGVFRITSGTL